MALAAFGLVLTRDICAQDSMAEGVENAICVICFMTQAYQNSDNCKLELQFAKQCGVEIVPVMAEGEGWRALRQPPPVIQSLGGTRS